MFIGKLIPYDGVPTKVIDTVPIPLVAIISLLAVFGIALAVGCLIFNMVFKEKKCVCDTNC